MATAVDDMFRAKIEPKFIKAQFLTPFTIPPGPHSRFGDKLLRFRAGYVLLYTAVPLIKGFICRVPYITMGFVAQI